MMMVFDNSFYLQPTIVVARALLGALLVRTLPEGRLVGRIVETEAYLHDDPACHGVRELPDGSLIHRRTKRNAAMFGPPGHAYVYFTYGYHFLFNVVTAPDDIPEAVLIRAIEPLEGIEVMARNRGMNHLHQLTNGPGKLAQALAIDKALDGHHLAQPPLRLEPGDPVDDIIAATRIGISRAQERLYRFYEKDNGWVSKN